jgi:hypothetical protein
MQRSATKLRDVEQLTLIPERRPIASEPVSLQHIPLLKTTADALDYACRLAKVVPKEICSNMGCDKTVWSRICSGEWDLDGRDILKFDRTINNDAYLLFLVHQHGYDLASLRKRGDDKDRRIAELEQELADERRLSAKMVHHMRGGAK